MPVLMNKGTDPHQASWLFFTERAELEAFAQAAVEQRFDAGRLAVDEADLASAGKASATVPVYLQVETLVPEDFDISTLGAKFSGGAHVDEAGEEELEEGASAQAAEKTAQAEPAEGDEASAGDEAPAAANPWDDEAASELPYEPVAAPQGLRIALGRTTVAAAQTYLRAEDAGEGTWDARLPGLQVLASIVAFTTEHGGTPEVAVWNLDGAGILRMSPAKKAKPMAGNILSCKL
jgi:hypothetical protein